MDHFRFEFNKQLQETMRRHAESIAKIYEPMFKLQNLPALQELQEKVRKFSKLADEIAFENQETMKRLMEVNNHPGLKAFSEHMELIGKQFSTKISVDLVGSALKGFQASFDGLEISEEHFIRAFQEIEEKDFVKKFEESISNLEKGHSTAQGIQIGLGEVLAFLMFLLMCFQTLDKSTDKALEQLSEGQEITNKLLERIVELNTNTDEIVNQSKSNQFKLLIANKSVPLLANPSTDSDTLITLFKGQHLDQLEEKGDWYKVQIYDKSTSENEIGWIQKKYIIPEIELGQTISKKLGDIASSSKGKKPNLIEDKPGDGLIPYVDIQGFEEREFRKYTDGKGCRLCEEGDLLMVWDGSRSGLVGKAPAGAIGSTLAKIELDGITNEYGYYFLKSHYQYLNTNPKGSGTPHVDPDLLWNLDIRVPTIEEQHRIVEKIEELFSELDNGVENLKKAQKQLKTYRQAVLKDAFEGKLTKEWREQQDDLPTPEELLQQIKAERKARRQRELAEWEKEVEQWEKEGESGRKPRKPAKSKNVNTFEEEEIRSLPKLPEKWSWIRLGNLANDIQIGPFGSLLHKSDYIENGIPVINPSNIKNEKILPDHSITISEEKFYELKKYTLIEGDVIIGRRGEMGRSALVTNKENGWLCGTGSLFLKLNDCSESSFITKYVRSKFFKDYLNNNSRGTTMKNLNATILAKSPVPLLSKKEQYQIVQEIESRLSVVDQLEQTIKENLQKAEALRQSILKKAFGGELVEE